MTISEDTSAEFSDITGHRGKLARWLERMSVQMTFLGVIILNAVLMGVSTSAAAVERYGTLLDALDRVVVAIFVIEMALKLYAYRHRFFYSAWNVFDLAIVVISLVPATQTLSALRGLRVIRSMRVLSAIPQMRDVIRALFDALPGMGAVMLLLLIFFYIFAVMATVLYGPTFPQWFGSVGASLYSLFQIMTLESWSMGIVRPVMEAHPYAWAFFVPFIICTAFAVLNLFIGLLVNTMQAAVEEAQDEELSKILNMVQDQNARAEEQMSAMREELSTLRAELGKRDV
ncbi:MAG: ion transporter [Pseudomonadota bacterium]